MRLPLNHFDSFDTQQGYPGFFALITAIFSAVTRVTDGIPRVCFTSLTSFMDKRLLTNRPCYRGRERVLEIPGSSYLADPACETLRFYIWNVSRWMERITITNTLKWVFCSVPSSDLSKNVEKNIEACWLESPIQAPFPDKYRSVLRTYVAENEIVCCCYLTPFMFIGSVAYRYVYLNPYREGYTNIYRVIAIVLLAISHCLLRNLPGGR